MNHTPCVKAAIGFILLAGLGMLLMPFFAFSAMNSNPILFSTEEQQWIKDHQNTPLHLGLDPYSGMEYFKEGHLEKGYVYPLIKAIEEKSGLSIDVVTDQEWEGVYNGLQTGDIDILLGANETNERREYMNFTDSIHQYPYVLLTKSGENIYTIGDLDQKRVGFISDDMISSAFPQAYKNIEYTGIEYGGQLEAFQGLLAGEIEAFITAGGETTYGYLFKFPQVSIVSEIGTLFSDMTLSTRKEDDVLRNILNKTIAGIGENAVQQMISDNRRDYIQSILPISPAERTWLQSSPTIRVGITKDYLPFDYYSNEKYLGISGAILNDITEKTGIKCVYVYDDFDTLYGQLLKGEIDVLNVVKTEERKNYMLFTKPYLLERDEIFGKVGSKDVIDIYGLENKRVAVIKGYYQGDMLRKNLVDVELIQVENITEAIKLVNRGKADYLIENPSVIRYYSEELGIHTLIKKGTTNTDTYLYYGINLKKPALAHVLNSVLPLVQSDVLAIKGYEELPHKRFIEKNLPLIGIILLLGVVLTGTILKLRAIFGELIKERTAKEILIERERYLYTDHLTGLNNRNYFMDKLFNDLNALPFPQTVIICDMNELKRANDEFGHLVGNQLLQAFGRFLKSQFEGHQIFRMGGDEFLVFEMGENAKYLEDAYHRLMREQNEGILITNEGKELRVWASYGIATRTNDEIDFEEVIRMADTQMYEAKAAWKINN